jgi:hypothetical protein
VGGGGGGWGGGGDGRLNHFCCRLNDLFVGLINFGHLNHFVGHRTRFIGRLIHFIILFCSFQCVFDFPCSIVFLCIHSWCL